MRDEVGKLAAAKGVHAIEVFDAVPAPLERRAGFERAQLLVRSKSRGALQPFLREWRHELAGREARRVRWALDVDPQEV